MPGVKTSITASEERNARDGVEAAGEGLADRDAVGADPLVLEGEELPGAAEARLDLVEDQEAVVPVGQLAQAPQVAVRRDDDAALALDRLDEDGAGLRA